MTAKEALKQIWRDTYPKACETWSVDILTKHWRVVEQALEELEAIKSADGGEAMIMFNEIMEYINEEVFVDFKEEKNYISNFILKSQQQAKELAELKEKVSRYITLKNRLYMAQNEAMSKLEFDEYIKLEKTLQRK